MSRPPMSRVKIRRYKLLECCDSELCKGIQRNNGGVALSRKPLDDIMKAIKTLAVRVENPTVARDRLHNMSQDREERVRASRARLRGQAATCQYTKACTCLLAANQASVGQTDSRRLRRSLDAHGTHSATSMACPIRGVRVAWRVHTSSDNSGYPGKI